ncbi:MAG: thrombospondin type 3 repeat-containing protein [Candidatus Nomurabacteria bacterium]|nr:thrombospondin type 3 repeat-containing protein [Candidatus Nomurabacteria bacterium]
MSYFNKNKKIFVALCFVLVFMSVIFAPLNLQITSAQSLGDTDGDGVLDLQDNCGNLYNPFQLDLNNNNIGDDCEFNNLDDNSNAAADENTTYVPLAPLTGELEGPYDTTGACPLGRYLSILFNLFLGIAAVLAMIMIFVGGIEYMGSELISSKESGMSKVKNAIAGLLLALASYLILNEINPKLLNICLGDIPNANITIDPVSPNSINPKEGTPGNIARCTPLTSGPCAPENLSVFGDKAEDMSKICNVESGGNADAVSGTDVGTDVTAFSFGLFQINLLANGVYVGPECENLFITNSGNKEIPPAKYIQKDSNGKYKYDAKLKPGMEAQYNSCKAKLMDPATNLAIAKKLFDVGAGMKKSPWGNMHAWMGDYGVCGSAFD